MHLDVLYSKGGIVETIFMQWALWDASEICGLLNLKFFKYIDFFSKKNLCGHRFFSFFPTACSHLSDCSLTQTHTKQRQACRLDSDGQLFLVVNFPSERALVKIREKPGS